MQSFPKLKPSRVHTDTLGELKSEGLGLWMQCLGPRPRCPSETLDLDRLITHFGPDRRIDGLTRKCPLCGSNETQIHIEWNAGARSHQAAQN